MSISAAVYFVKWPNKTLCVKCGIELALKGEDIEMEASDSMCSPCTCSECGKLFS